jgi:transcriptional regulator with XRE-family HTH domain
MMARMLPMGRAIKAARVLVGMSARELARDAGCDPSTVHRLESSGSRPISASAATWEALKAALLRRGVTIEPDGLRLVRRPRR